MRCARSSPSTNSITRAVTPSLSSRPWIGAIFGWFSEARVFASRWKRASRSASCANASRQNLHRDVTIQLRVASPEDLAHSAFADAGDNFVDTETGTGSKGQRWRDYMGGMAVRDGSFLLDDAVFLIECGAGRNTLADYHASDYEATPPA